MNKNKEIEEIKERLAKIEKILAVGVADTKIPPKKPSRESVVINFKQLDSGHPDYYNAEEDYTINQAIFTYRGNRIIITVTPIYYKINPHAPGLVSVIVYNNKNEEYYDYSSYCDSGESIRKYIDETLQDMVFEDDAPEFLRYEVNNCRGISWVVE